MDLDSIFASASALSLVGWALLVFAPRWRLGTDVIAPFVIPGLLAFVYLMLLATAPAGSDEAGFSTLAGVRALFADDVSLLAGWLHYLVFDLVVGAWELRDARERGVPHLVLVPCLLVTMFVGPIGYLLYLLARTFARRAVAEHAPPRA